MARSLGVLTLDLIARIGGFTAGMSEAERAADKSTREIARKNRERAKEVEMAWEGIGKVIAGAFAGISVAGLFKTFMSESIAAQNEASQLAAALKSTGQAAGYSAAELNKMGQSLAGKSIFSEGEITRAQTRLLSYTGVVGKEFPRAMQAVADMSARMGMSVESSAETIGRALDIPSQGLTALQRQGFRFTESQKLAVQQLEETGRVAEAQSIVLSALESSYGGAAEAARNTLGGAAQALQNQLKALMTGSDGSLDGVTGAVNDLADTMASPAVKNAFASLTEALANIARNAVSAMTAIINFSKFVGESLGRLFHGSEDPVERLDEQIASIEKTIAAASRSTFKQPIDKLQAELDRLRKIRSDLVDLMLSAPGQSKTTGQSPTTLSDADINRLAGEKKARDDAARAAKAQGDAYQKLINDINAKTGVMLLEAEGQAKLTGGEQFALKIMQDLQAGTIKLTNAQKAQLRIRLESMLIAEKSNAAEKERAESLKKSLDAIKAQDAAQAAATKAARDGYAALAEQNAKLKEEIEMIGKSEYARKALTRQKQQEIIADKELELQAAIYNNASAEQINLLAREIALRKQNLALSQNKDILEANDALRRSEITEWQRTWDQVSQSFTDALMQGGKSVSEYLQGLFRTMVLRPILSPIGGAASYLLGGGASAGQSGAMGAIGSISNVASMFSGGLVSGLASSIGSIGSMIGSTAVQSFATGMSSVLAPGLMGPTMAGAGGAAGLGASAGALMSNPWTMGIAALALSWDSLFGRKLKDQGLQGTFGAGGFEGQMYQFYKGGLLRSDKTTTSAIDPALGQMLDQQYAALRASTSQMADVLGLSASAVDTFTTSIKLSFNGLSESEIQSKLQDELENIANLLADQVLEPIEAAAGYSKAGERAVDTMRRLSSSLLAVHAAFGAIGKTMLDASLAGADLASSLVDAFGSLENFNTLMGSYQAGYTSQAEQFAVMQQQLAQAFAGINQVMPSSIADFRRLADAQDLTTASGREAYASIMALNPAFLALASVVEDVFDSISATTAQSVRDIEMSVLGDAAKYQYLNDEIEGLITQLSGATLPAEIQSLFEQINRDTMAAYNLLSDTEQQRLSAQFIDRLYEVEAIAQSRLSVTGDIADSAESQAQAAFDMRAIVAEMREIRDTELTTATMNRQAAELALQAAQTPKTVHLVDQYGQRINSREVVFG